MDTLDTRVRLAAFQFVQKQQSLFGDAIPRDLLVKGFDFEGTRVPLLSPEGIFKPRILPEIPLSFATVPIIEGKTRPYEDEIDPSGLIRYRYRGQDPMHRANVGLRLAMERKTPLIYFYGIIPGRYAAAWPSFVVGDDPGSLTFTVEIDEKPQSADVPLESELNSFTRAYVTVATQRRLHQQSFRWRVIHAYRHACTICCLKHVSLLEAAHILPDKHPKGEPWVSNGLSFCKLHHAAFDAHIIGVRPDLVVEVRGDVLEETDGPMLQHGLKGCHNQPLAILPSSRRDQPRREFLEERYEMFRAAG